jgi:L-2,4-diaminobutyric acid acetyltransferase
MSTATATKVETIVRQPYVDDGAEMWRVARDSVRLDLNTPYAYMLWARDFHATSLVVEAEGRVCGFVTGYRRPEESTTLMIWQIAVDEELRGQGLAGRLLDEVVRRTGVYTLETTVTADNDASQRLFRAFARRHQAQHTVSDLFAEEHFPAGQNWDAELLHRITPLRRTARSDHYRGGTPRAKELS